MQVAAGGKGRAGDGKAELAAYKYYQDAARPASKHTCDVVATAGREESSMGCGDRGLEDSAPPQILRRL